MKIPANILEILSRADVDGKSLKLVGNLDRKDYEKTNAVLEALGGKWNRKAKVHLFADDVQPLLDVVIDNGEVTTVREKTASLGYFPTPAKLADLLSLMANVSEGDDVLEPSAGEGAIVKACQRNGGRVFAVEFDPTRRAIVAALIGADYVYGVNDFLDTDPPDERHGQWFDAVVMNPPFVKVGRGDHLDHVQHAFKFLRPGGYLVTILPSSIEFRTDRRHRDFRLWLRECGGYPAQITKCPDGSFHESGTNVSTVIVKIQK